MDPATAGIKDTQKRAVLVAAGQAMADAGSSLELARLSESRVVQAVKVHVNAYLIGPPLQGP